MPHQVQIGLVVDIAIAQAIRLPGDTKCRHHQIGASHDILERLGTGRLSLHETVGAEVLRAAPIAHQRDDIRAPPAELGTEMVSKIPGRACDEDGVHGRSFHSLDRRTAPGLPAQPDQQRFEAERELPFRRIGQSDIAPHVVALDVPVRNLLSEIAHQQRMEGVEPVATEAKQVRHGRVSKMAETGAALGIVTARFSNGQPQRFDVSVRRTIRCRP